MINIYFLSLMVISDDNSTSWVCLALHIQILYQSVTILLYFSSSPTKEPTFELQFSKICPAVMAHSLKNASHVLKCSAKNKPQPAFERNMEAFPLFQTWTHAYHG